MAMYVGVNGTPKEISSLYVGVNGVPKECTEVYAGDNGSVKLVENYKAKNVQIFTSSETFTVPKSGNYDIFLVGGGCSGNGGSPTITENYGGGSGYTITNQLALSKGETVSISIGSGSTGFYINGSDTIVNNITCKGGSSMDGGSGGGRNIQGGTSGYTPPTKGGSDGGYGEPNMSMGVLFYGGKGQGTTTRAFGDADGTLYAGGGGGGGYSGVSILGAGGGDGGGGNGGSIGAGYPGQSNTGGGGGGGEAGSYSNTGGAGGSGIVIIRQSK